MRIWFSGPRLFNGLIRPGISISTAELTRKHRASPVRHGGGNLYTVATQLAEHEPARELSDLAAPAHEPIPLHARVIAWVIYGFAVYGFLALIGCVGGGAHAWMCRMYQDGGYAVTSCEDGSYTVRGSDGKVRQYGERNGGFERYPGQGQRPVFERRD